MMHADHTGIVVAGTGFAGLIAALALARVGFAVTLVGPRGVGDDRRTTALMEPALKMLGDLGLREALAAEGAPLRAMRILDGTARLLRSPAVTFHASEIGEEAFGLNIPNAALGAALTQAVSATPAIVWKDALVTGWELAGESATALLDDGGAVTAKLAVAADGRRSLAREAAGIGSTTRTHRQSALVLSFSHTREHGSISTEFHTETGPFTQVPLPGLRSSLVWVVDPEEADTLAVLDDTVLSERIEARMQSMLGRVTAEPGRQIYPLASAMPSRFAARRVALVGEAAHLFPPIGAQGLNLGVRDVADLAEIAAEHFDDPGSEAALRRYDRRRRPDVTARSAAVNLLNLSLLSNLLPAQIARSAGLSLLSVLPPLRAFFMREGMQPGAGFARATSTLRERVGRYDSAADGEQQRGDAQH